jgi:hypothetical protein
MAFKMKGFSPFTKKTDNTTTQTDERVFGVDQTEYDNWNKSKNNSRGPDVRYLGSKEHNSTLEAFLRWKKANA